MDITYKPVTAAELTGGIGQQIANVGEVKRVRVEGAFLHVDVATENWTPVGGYKLEGWTTLFLHSTDTVILTEVR